MSDGTKNIHEISIELPCAVEMTMEDRQALDRLARRMCERHQRANPGTTMWPSHGGIWIRAGEEVYTLHCTKRPAHASELEERTKKSYSWYDPQEMFYDIAEFHEKFNLAYSGPPRALPADLASFRTKFIMEELVEYLFPDKKNQKKVMAVFMAIFQEALSGDDLPSLEKQFDALIDLVYVALGTAYMHGFPFDEGWRRVHEANMKKIRSKNAGDASDRGGSNDVVKPPGWMPPDLSDLVAGEE